MLSDGTSSLSSNRHQVLKMTVREGVRLLVHPGSVAVCEQHPVSCVVSSIRHVWKHPHPQHPCSNFRGLIPITERLPNSDGLVFNTEPPRCVVLCCVHSESVWMSWPVAGPWCLQPAGRPLLPAAVTRLNPHQSDLLSPHASQHPLRLVWPLVSSTLPSGHIFYKSDFWFGIQG